MRHLRLAAAAAALLLGACYGAPEDLPPVSTTTGTTSAANTTGAGTSATSATNGGGTGQSTGAGYTDSTSTSTGSACAMPCQSGADCPSQTGQTGPAVCLSSGQCEYTIVVGEGWTTEDLCPSTASSAGTTGTSTTTGSSGSCGCQSDADCVAIYGSGATCANGACWITGPNNGAIGGTTGCGTTGDTTTGTTGTSSTTGTTGTCGCQSDADCAQYGSGAVCQNGGCYISGPGTGTITGTTGCGGSSTTTTTTTTTGSTTGGACCTSDADCVATWGAGATCSNGACFFSGPNGGTIGSTGCGGGNTSTTTTGTTGAGCANPCNTVSDCPTFADSTLAACNGGLCYYSFSCSSTGGGGGAAVCPGTDPGGCGTSSTTGGSSTPLVLSFDGAPVRFTLAQGRFELGQGDAKTTDWVDARTPWLALDVNGNGRIDSGEELFGSLTRLPDGTRAANGFQALRALDANRDGRIDAKDPAFARLVLWRDADQDRQSRASELVSVARAGVVAIELGYSTSDRCDARGNCERERASFVYRTARGELRRGQVVDVHLAHRPALLSAR